MKKRHWFHCTSNNHGKEFVAARRAPLLRADGEVETPRLCVAPNIAACFAAVMFHNGRQVYVYRTKTPRRTVMPVNVWDQIITQERWLVPPVDMVLVEVIDADVADRIQCGARLVAMSGQKSSIRRRIMQYARAAEELGAPKGALRALSRIREALGLTMTPDNYMLGEALRNQK